MDEINNFFDLSKEFKRMEAPRTGISENYSSIAGSSKSLKREFVDEGSSDEWKSEGKSKMDKLDIVAPRVGSVKSGIELDEDYFKSDDELESDIDEEQTRYEDTYYDRFAFDMNRDSSLPIYDSREKILMTIEKHSVVVLKGDTGCGKTTQVPQYILDEACRRRQYCKIVCTQPRRIAAISIAKRICEERQWFEGSVCSYQVGLHCNQNEDTRLLYCTTGVLLQRLIRDKTLTQFTHIILDEVHERDQEMDFLLIVIRRLLLTNSQHVKIILMSATINSAQFSNYFSINRQPAPVLRVDSRRNYQVREFYTDNLSRIHADTIEVCLEEPRISDEMYAAALKLLVVIESIEKQEQAQYSQNTTVSSILVFLPGIYEIDQFHFKMNALLESQTAEQDNMKLKFYPIRLHSLISPDEQIRVFQPPPNGFRKVILATNIAESSITVPDVKYVIDFCLTKLLITDSATNFSTLQLQWASRANCLQRAGRAGRVMNGRVYRMISKFFYDNLDEFSLPEMLRCPLEKIVLKAKILDMGSPIDILSLAIDAPDHLDIRNTVLMLKEVSALYSTSDGVYAQYDGDISYWGRVMNALPLDVRLSRLIVVGYMFSCFEEAVIIAAGLTVRGLFNQSMKNNNGTNLYGDFIQKLVLADGSGSDLIAIWRAYKLFKNMCRSKHSKDAEAEWAQRYRLNIGSLREMDLLVRDLFNRLKQFDINKNYVKDSLRWTDREKAIILKIVISGAFYPNYFIREKKNTLERERSIYNTLSGRDPCSTVYFKNFQLDSMGELYTRRIKEFFQCVNIRPEEMDVTFQQGSEKVFVTFKNNDADDENGESGNENFLVPARVNPNVVKAVRMRIDNIRHKLRVMDFNSARNYVNQRNIGVVIDGVWQPSGIPKKHAELIVLPSMFTKKMRGYISHVGSCGKFFFQPMSEVIILKEIQSLLNEPDEMALNRFSDDSHIRVGMVLAALRHNTFQRAVILKFVEHRASSKRFLVRFIDFGNTSVLRLQDLRNFSAQNRYMIDYPPRKFKCRLAGVQPSALTSMNSIWNESANDELRKIAEKGVIEIEIYSLVGNLTNVIIKEQNGNFNERLIATQLARRADEDYLSKMDHDFRMRKQVAASHFTEDQRVHQNEEYLQSLQLPTDFDLTPPELYRCTKTISLIGPFSPLEIEMHSMLPVGSGKSVLIQRDSVNAVLFNADPQDLHDNMVVATSVNECCRGEKLVARGTSVMPNIHGFTGFMIMMFCPRLQIKCNRSRTKYISLLAGLGYDEQTMKSLYKEHDVVLTLDVDILKDDICLINKLRYLMDKMFHTANNDEVTTYPASCRGVIAGDIKKTITRLLNKNRSFVEPHFECDERRWKKPDENEMETVENVFGKRTLFAMHDVPGLYEEKFEHINALNTNCKKLYYLQQFDVSFEAITCQLCNETLETINHLRLHLLSQLHRDREQQIGFKR